MASIESNIGGPVPIDVRKRPLQNWPMTHQPITDGHPIANEQLDPNVSAAAVEFAHTLRQGAITVAGLAGTGALGPAAGRAGDVALVLAGWQGPLQAQFRLSAATEAAKAVAVEQALRAEADAWEHLAADANNSQRRSTPTTRPAAMESSGGRVPVM